MAAMHMNEKQYREEMAQGTAFLVDFWAPWCSYCRRIGPAYDQVADQYAQTLPVVKINIDEEPALAQELGIEVIPTLVLYREGKIVDSIVAPGSKAAIEDFLKKNLR